VNHLDAIAKAKELLMRTKPLSKTIETIIVYKFPSLSREEIERMLGLSELRQTKVYQEALEEGREEGIAEGEQTGAVKEARSLILRQLSRRVGTLPANVEAQVQALALPQLEALGEALLDFGGLDDLMRWLRAQV
jgi:predicted transposase YdaD